MITGHKGYIGSVMVPIFVAAGHDVVGLDTGYFRGCSLGGNETPIDEMEEDLREITADDLAGFDAVVHLAALSNDPVGNLSAAWTTSINRDASIRLATLARDAGVRRFLFSSSCIMYGMTKAGVVTEESPLAPLTEYGRSKAASERGISALASEGFSPTFLRNGTVYGISPQMRLDTVLNDFVAQAFLYGKIVVLSDGKPWRPVVHVQDIADSFLHVLAAPLHLIHDQVFNNGANRLNYQISELANIVAEIVPGVAVRVNASKEADQRTYKASFQKIEETFPGLSFQWDARKGARELYGAYKEMGLSREDYEGKRFSRLRWLTYLIESGRLDRSLRWCETSVRAR